MGTVPRSAILVVGTLLLVAATFVALPLVSAHGNEVAADSQLSTDGTVLVETTLAVTDAWLVVHSDANGSVGDPIGHTALNATSVRTDIPVEIKQEVWRDWGESRRVHVVLHSEDGDGMFEPGEDTPITRDDSPIAETIIVGRADSAGYVGLQGFHPHETSGHLTIRHVRMPVDGYLVVHNSSLDGTIGGYTTLAPGTSNNVTVHLNTTFLRNLDSESELTTVLYRDDGDGGFDPASDRVVQAGTDPVASTVSVHVNISALPTVATETEHRDTHVETTTDHGEHTHEDSGSEHEAGTATTTPPDTDTPAGMTTVSNASGPGFGILIAVIAIILTLGLRRY